MNILKHFFSYSVEVALTTYLGTGATGVRGTAMIVIKVFKMVLTKTRPWEHGFGKLRDSYFESKNDSETTILKQSRFSTNLQFELKFHDFYEI